MVENQRYKKYREQLKQSQKQLAISELEKVFYGLQRMKYITVFDNYGEPVQVWEKWQVLDYINNHIRELKGERK